MALFFEIVLNKLWLLDLYIKENILYKPKVYRKVFNFKLLSLSSFKFLI